MGPIITLILFFLLILVHELGHFAGAKLSGVCVYELSIGMGPLIYKKQFGETQYSFRALPIGGYVRLEDERKNNSNSFKNAKTVKKLLILVAGVLMNLVFAFFILFIIGLNLGKPVNKVEKTLENYQAHEYLMANDIIESVNGIKLTDISEINKLVDASAKSVELTIIRNGEQLKIKADKGGDGKLGIVFQRKTSITWALKFALSTVTSVVIGLFNFIYSSLTRGLDIDNLSGPIGIIAGSSEIYKAGIIEYLFFMSYLSINLAVANILPIPGLDGFHILVNIIEEVFNTKISERRLAFINLIGLMLLFILIISITINDIRNLRW